MPIRTRETAYAAIIESEKVVLVSDSPDLEKRHRKAYQKLLDSLGHLEQRRGMRMNNLSDNLFSLSISKSVRVLAVRQYLGGRCCWAIMELETDHDRYEHSIQQFNVTPALKLLSDYARDDQSPELIAACGGGGGSSSDAGESHSESAADAAPLDAETQLQLIRRSAAIYRNQVIRCSDIQDEYLQRIKMGLTKDNYLALVSGRAGSGKSFMAFVLIEWLAEELAEGIFLAASENLQHEQRKQWLASPLSSEVNADSMVFCGYQDLLKSINLLIDTPNGLEVCLPDGEHLVVVDDKHLQTYFQSIQADDSLKALSFTQFKQECSVMLGEKANYMALGISDSLFRGDGALKEALWSAFEGYRTLLREGGLCHLDFFLFVVEKPLLHKVVLADECLDWNRFQLTSLMNLCSRLVLKGDLNQALTDTSNLMGYAQNKVGECGGDMFELVGTHRSRQNIASVGAQVLTIKGKLRLRRPAGSLTVNSLLHERGWVSHVEEVKYVEGWYNSTATAVICHPALVESMKEKCRTPLVGGIEAFKGLGFPRVVIVNCLQRSSDEGRQIAIKLLEVLKRKAINKDEITPEDLALLPELHALYTAVMRTEVELVFATTGNTKAQQAMSELIGYLCGNVHAPDPDEMGIQQTNNLADWQRERQRMLAAGNTDVAEAITQKTKADLSVRFPVPGAGAGVVVCFSDPEKSQLDQLLLMSSELIREHVHPKHLHAFLFATSKTQSIEVATYMKVFLMLRQHINVESLEAALSTINEALRDVPKQLVASRIYQEGDCLALMLDPMPLHLLAGNSKSSSVLKHWLKVSYVVEEEVFSFSSAMSSTVLSKYIEYGSLKGKTLLHALADSGLSFLAIWRKKAWLQAKASRKLPKTMTQSGGGAKSSIPTAQSLPSSVGVLSTKQSFDRVFTVSNLIKPALDGDDKGKSPWHVLLLSNSGCDFVWNLMHTHSGLFDQLMLLMLQEALTPNHVSAAVLTGLFDLESGRNLLSKWLGTSSESSSELLTLAVSLVLTDSPNTILLSGLSGLSVFETVIQFLYQWIAEQSDQLLTDRLMQVVLRDPVIFSVFIQQEKGIELLCQWQEKNVELLSQQLKSYLNPGVEDELGDRRRQLIQNQLLRSAFGQRILLAWIDADPGGFSESMQAQLLSNSFDHRRILLLDLYEDEDVGRALLFKWQSLSQEPARIVLLALGKQRNQEFLFSFLSCEQGLPTLVGYFSAFFEEPNLLSNVLRSLHQGIRESQPSRAAIAKCFIKEAVELFVKILLSDDSSIQMTSFQATFVRLCIKLSPRDSIASKMSSKKGLSRLLCLLAFPDPIVQACVLRTFVDVTRSYEHKQTELASADNSVSVLASFFLNADHPADHRQLALETLGAISHLPKVREGIMSIIGCLNFVDSYLESDESLKPHFCTVLNRLIGRSVDESFPEDASRLRVFVLLLSSKYWLVQEHAVSAINKLIAPFQQEPGLLAESDREILAHSDPINVLVGLCNETSYHNRNVREVRRLLLDMPKIASKPSSLAAIPAYLSYLTDLVVSLSSTRQKTLLKNAIQVLTLVLDNPQLLELQPDFLKRLISFLTGDDSELRDHAALLLAKWSGHRNPVQHMSKIDGLTRFLPLLVGANSLVCQEAVATIVNVLPTQRGQIRVEDEGNMKEFCDAFIALLPNKVFIPSDLERHFVSQVFQVLIALTKGSADQSARILENSMDKLMIWLHSYSDGELFSEEVFSLLFAFLEHENNLLTIVRTPGSIECLVRLLKERSSKLFLNALQILARLANSSNLEDCHSIVTRSDCLASLVGLLQQEKMSPHSFTSDTYALQAVFGLVRHPGNKEDFVSNKIIQNPYNEQERVCLASQCLATFPGLLNMMRDKQVDAAALHEPLIGLLCMIAQRPEHASEVASSRVCFSGILSAFVGDFRVSPLLREEARRAIANVSAESRCHDLIVDNRKAIQCIVDSMMSEDTELQELSYVTLANLSGGADVYAQAADNRERLVLLLSSSHYNIKSIALTSFHELVLKADEDSLFEFAAHPGVFDSLLGFLGRHIVAPQALPVTVTFDINIALKTLLCLLEHASNRELLFNTTNCMESLLYELRYITSLESKQLILKLFVYLSSCAAIQKKLIKQKGFIESLSEFVEPVPQRSQVSSDLTLQVLNIFSNVMLILDDEGKLALAAIYLPLLINLLPPDDGSTLSFGIKNDEVYWSCTVCLFRVMHNLMGSDGVLALMGAEENVSCIPRLTYVLTFLDLVYDEGSHKEIKFLRCEPGRAKGEGE